MDGHQLIEGASPADRDALAVILVKNGYTVKITKKTPAGTRTKTYVEYWR